MLFVSLPASPVRLVQEIFDAAHLCKLRVLRIPSIASARRRTG